MFRRWTWRTAATEAVTRHQEESLNSTIIILKQLGPTGFILIDEMYHCFCKVFLGDPHTCTCDTFLKEKELCKHICWLLMRKFHLPRHHEYCFQLGLTEGQILEVLDYRKKRNRSDPAQLLPDGEHDGTTQQKSIMDDDICPVCQEEFHQNKRRLVTHCRFGCGQNFHISCIKMSAQYQREFKKDMVKCPMCRGSFGTRKMLQEVVKNASLMCTPSEKVKLENHLGISCNKCKIYPISGKCFKCTVCPYYHLCENCFTIRHHSEHSFAMRMKRNQSWTLMEEQKTSVTENEERCSKIETGVVTDVVPCNVFRQLPVTMVYGSSRLRQPGMQCRLCLQRFHVDQWVKTLPCQHKFHSSCIKTWLQQSNCCPVDWHVVYNPLRWKGTDNKPKSTAPSTSSANLNGQLFISSIGLQKNEGSDRSETDPRAPPVLHEPIVQDVETFGSTQNASQNSGQPSSFRLDQESACDDVRSERVLVSCGQENERSGEPEPSSLNGRIGPTQPDDGDGVGLQTQPSGTDQSNPDLQPENIPITQ